MMMQTLSIVSGSRMSAEPVWDWPASTGGTPVITQRVHRFSRGYQNASMSVFAEVGQLEDRMTEILRQVKALLASEEREEVPEVFDLQALDERRVMARVEAVEPAVFYFAAETGVEDPDD